MLLKDRITSLYKSIRSKHQDITILPILIQDYLLSHKEEKASLEDFKLMATLLGYKTYWAKKRFEEYLLK